MQNFTLITWCLRPENALKSASKVDLLSPAMPGMFWVKKGLRNTQFDIFFQDIFRLIIFMLMKS